MSWDSERIILSVFPFAHSFFLCMLSPSLPNHYCVCFITKGKRITFTIAHTLQQIRAKKYIRCKSYNETSGYPIEMVTLQRQYHFMLCQIDESFFKIRKDM